MTVRFRMPLSACLLSLALLLPCDGLAQISRTGLPRSPFDGSSVAVGGDGIVHIIYLSLQHLLRHTWLEGRHWLDEPVDIFSEAGFSNSAVVDSQGRVHVAYYADRTVLGGTGTLAYAVRDGSGWTITDIGPGGLSPSIAIGAGDLPRILHLGSTTGPQYASFNGVSWDLEGVGITGDSITGTSLVLDGGGHAHATLETDTQLYYGTNVSGSWAGGPIGAGGASASLVLDPLDHPHVLAAFPYSGAFHSLQHLWDDGSGWQAENLAASVTLLTVDKVALAADGEGGLFVLFSGGVPWAKVTLFAFFDGFDWRSARTFDHRNAGFEVSLARGPDGSFHGIYSKRPGGKHMRVEYARIRLPNLKASWDAVEVVTEGAGKRLQGTLRIRNVGAAPSMPARISFFLSDDDILDSKDMRLDYELKVGATPPGMERIVPVSLGVIEPGGGRRVLAVVDPDLRILDTNRLNNTAAVVLFP